MVSRERSGGGVLDDMSKAIIEKLQEDGRRPTPESARPSACRRPRCASGCSG